MSSSRMIEVFDELKEKKENYDKKLQAEIKLPECFLGHILIESTLEDVEAYYKQKANLSSDSLLVIPESVTAKYDVPTKKGKILKMAPDTFGKWFQEKYGDIGYLPKVGDTIIYLATTAIYIDIERKYALIPETSIKGYYKGE